MVTDADEYDNRQVLLFAQLLHINGISNRDKLVAANMNLINQIINSFINHKVMKLQNKSIKLVKKSQLIDLYDNLLLKYSVNNTVELANSAFFLRIEELETLTQSIKTEFKQILQN